MRALVTGASGFVGRHLVAHLRAMGDDVVVTNDTGDWVVLTLAEWSAFVASELPADSFSVFLRH